MPRPERRWVIEGTEARALARASGSLAFWDPKRLAAPDGRLRTASRMRAMGGIERPRPPATLGWLRDAIDSQRLCLRPATLTMRGPESKRLKRFRRLDVKKEAAIPKEDRLLTTCGG